MSARFDTSVVSSTRTRDTLEKRGLAEKIAKEREAEELAQLEAENERLRREASEIEESDPEFDIEPIDNETAIAEHARIQAETFVRNNPDYVVCPENFRTMVSYMTKQRISNPTAKHFQKAFDILRERGLMIMDKSLSNRPKDLDGVIGADGTTFKTYEEIERMNSAEYASFHGLKRGR